MESVVIQKKKNLHPLSLALPLLLRSIFRSPANLKVWRVAVQGSYTPYPGASCRRQLPWPSFLQLTDLHLVF